MEKQQQRSLLDGIGGEPIEESGFEHERSVAADEIDVVDSEDQQKGKQI